MDRDPDIDMTDIADTIDKEAKREEADFGKWDDDKPRPSNLKKKTLFIGGAIVLVIIFAALFPPRKSDLSKADFDALIERLVSIEERVTDIEGIEKRITTSLQVQKDTFKESVTTASGTGGTIAQQLDVLAQKVEVLEKKMEYLSEEVHELKTDTAEHAQAKKTQYHVVVRGDSLYRIAKKYGLTVNELCKLNKITPRQSIYPGQKLQVFTAKD